MDIMQKSVTFFSTLEFKYTNLKTVQIKSKNMQCTIISIRVIICEHNRAGYTKGPPMGTGAKGPNQQGQAKTTDWDTLPPAPVGGPQRTRPPFCFKIMTLIDKIVHFMFLLLNGSVFKLLYLSSEVEKKVTHFCIISILVLLTHMQLSLKKNYYLEI